MHSEFDDLHARVADEVAALADRLVSERSTSYGRRLEEARQAFAAAAASIESTLADAAFVSAEGESLRGQLAAHPAFEAFRVRLQEQDDIIARLQGQVASVQADLAAAQAEVTTARAERDAARSETDAVASDLLATQRDLSAAHTQVDALRVDLDATCAELASERDSAMHARADAARMTAELQTASSSSLDAARAELQQHAEMNLRLQADLTGSHADLDVMRASLHAERQRTEEARAEIARMTEEFETTLDEMRREQATVAGEQALAYSSLPLDALLTMFNSLRRCNALPDVLTALVNGLSREFTRVALFDVHGSQLQGAQQVGFIFDHDISTIAMPLTPESFLGRAVTSGRLESCFPTLNSDASGVIPFGGSPACALAIPVAVQGTTVAVIYADDSDTQEFASASAQMRAKFAEILQQHAMLVLLRIGLHQKTVTELREFVSLLVDELEYAHTSNVDAGKNALERQQDLKENLDRSRRIYAQRIHKEGHTTSGLLEEHLWSVMEGRGDSTFARDLAVVLGSIGTAPRAASVLTMRR